MKTFFTGDTHYSHANIIKYCHRPFNDSVEMNEALIRNHNSVVGVNDLVYHLGDFGFGNREYHFDNIFRRLNGKIVFIEGNHDKLARANRHKFWAYHEFGHEVEIEGTRVVLCHYALRVWNKSHYGSFHLYGHSHGTLPDDPLAKSMDVGVDPNNYTPISWDQVKARMANKNWRPIDHHGERLVDGGVGLNREDYAKEVRRSQYLGLKKEFENE